MRLALTKIRRGEVRDPEKLSGFICNLARNLAIESCRQSVLFGTLDEAEAAGAVSDPAPDQLQRLLQEERAAAARQVLSELKTARDREILYRFYIAEQDKAQICLDLGLSSLHFNGVLHRARERFRQLCRSVAAGVVGDVR